MRRRLVPALAGRRLVPALAVVLVTAGALTACTAGASSGSTAGGGASSARFQAGEGRMPTASGGTAAAASSQARSVVTTGTVRLVADRPIAAAEAITRLAEGAGGRVGTSNEDPAGRASARLTLRIPADRFDDVLAGVKRQGEVRDVSIDATDVTAQVTDFAVRIANLRASIDRLRTLLAQAQDADALVRIESTLTERQTSLEQLLAQQRDLADRVSYATLSVSVVTPAAAPAQGPGDFLAGVAVGWDGLVRAVAATLVGLGVALPWLAVLAAAGGAGLLIRRRVRRRPSSA
ncbi:DUF4349 domain-containing protein [Amnibacterium endophyticum]|uniref:DUF4349 domain-containing protein n=1 Tax=Amnibacterium endophyticum TaxID=2109337 RepID=A0ABW4LFB6_9MICO